MAFIVHDLKKLIDQAIVNMAKGERTYFTSSIPKRIAWPHNQTIKGIITLAASVTCATLIMTIDAGLVAIVEEKPGEVQRLTEQ